MSKKLGYCRSCTVSIVLAFHKHNSLPLGHIRAFISFYYRASWKQLSAATDPNFSHFFTFNVGIKKVWYKRKQMSYSWKPILGQIFSWGPNFIWILLSPPTRQLGKIRRNNCPCEIITFINQNWSKMGTCSQNVLWHTQVQAKCFIILDPGEIRRKHWPCEIIMFINLLILVIIEVK